MTSWRLLCLFILISILASCIPEPTSVPLETNHQRDDGSWTLSFSGALTASFAKDPSVIEDDKIYTGIALRGSDQEGKPFTSFQFSQRNQDGFFFRLVATERTEDGEISQTMMVTLGQQIYQGKAILRFDESADQARLSGSIIGINLTNTGGDSFSLTGFFDVPIIGADF